MNGLANNVRTGKCMTKCEMVHCPNKKLPFSHSLNVYYPDLLKVFRKNLKFIVLISSLATRKQVQKYIPMNIVTQQTELFQLLVKTF